MAKQFSRVDRAGAGFCLSQVFRVTEGVTNAFWKQQSDRDAGRNSTREKIRVSARETCEQRTANLFDALHQRRVLFEVERLALRF